MLSDSQREQIKATIPVLREHGVALTSYFYNRMLTNHPELKEVFNLGHQRSGAQANALAGAVLAYAEHIDNPAVLAKAIDMITHKHVSLNIQAKDYATVGENLLASISEVLNVPMESELIAAWAAAYGQLADILIGIEQRLYDQQQAQGGWLGWREFKVVQKEQESSEITSFYLVPVDGKLLPAYQAGQYISLKVFVPELGLKQPRQYTLSDTPSADHFRISVKREDAQHHGQEPMAAGWVSNTLHQHVQVGNVVELSNPTGNFVLKDAHKANVLISAGVGITPMLSMLNHLAALGMPRPLSFLHACRNSQVQGMKDHIKLLNQQFEQLNVHINYEKATAQDKLGEDYHAQGLLDLNQLDGKLLPADADYYLCGPKPFMQAQYNSLTARGIAAGRIHLEAFGTGGVAV